MNNIELDLELEEEGGGRAEGKKQEEEGAAAAEEDQEEEDGGGGGVEEKEEEQEEEQQRKKKKQKMEEERGAEEEENKNRNKKNNTKMFLVDSERNSFVRRNVDQTNYHLRNTATNCECGRIVRNDIFPDIPFHEMPLLFLFWVTGVLTSSPEVC